MSPPNRLRLLAAAAFFGAVAAPVSAQTDLDYARNLVVCYTGTTPPLCRRVWLSDAEKLKADKAEREANLRRCLTGSYPSLCKRGSLSEEELRRVESAESQVNLQRCLMGRYPSLCKHDKLTSEQATQVAAAEEKSKAAARAYLAQPSASAPTYLYAPAVSHAGGACGSRGGPGWRKANGKCASWRD